MVKLYTSLKVKGVFTGRIHVIVRAWRIGRIRHCNRQIIFFEASYLFTTRWSSRCILGEMQLGPNGDSGLY